MGQKEVYEALCRLGPATTTEVAEALEIDLGSASRYLNGLARWKTVRVIGKSRTNAKTWEVVDG